MPRDHPRLSRYATYIVALAAGALLWQAVASQTNPAFLASFTATMGAIYDFIITGTLFRVLSSSLLVFFTGLGAAIVFGIGVGLLLARVRLLRVGLESYIMVVYATPMVALIPFIMSMMGFGFAPKALVVFLFAFFSILYNTIEGARSLKPEMLEVARSFRSGEWGVWRDVLIPYTLPYAMTGVRQGIGRGLVGLIAGEFFLSGTGIGLLIMQSERDFNVPALYGSILIITILGVLLMSIGRILENRFAAWRGLNR
ncbi:MAG TPA: ABC transporter permease [Xanthobacteraceae bacterium]|nr:ABC transporter permease [Xanthobacteraceae bacterium]